MVKCNPLDKLASTCLPSPLDVKDNSFPSFLDSRNFLCGCGMESISNDPLYKSNVLNTLLSIVCNMIYQTAAKPARHLIMLMQI